MGLENNRRTDPALLQSIESSWQNALPQLFRMACLNDNKKLLENRRPLLEAQVNTWLADLDPTDPKTFMPFAAAGFTTVYESKSGSAVTITDPTGFHYLVAEEHPEQGEFSSFFAGVDWAVDELVGRVRYLVPRHDKFGQITGPHPKTVLGKVVDSPPLEAPLAPIHRLNLKPDLKRNRFNDTPVFKAGNSGLFLYADPDQSPSLHFMPDNFGEHPATVFRKGVTATNPVTQTSLAYREWYADYAILRNGLLFPAALFSLLEYERSYGTGMPLDEIKGISNIEIGLYRDKLFNNREIFQTLSVNQAENALEYRLNLRAARNDATLMSRLERMYHTCLRRNFLMSVA